MQRSSLAQMGTMDSGVEAGHPGDEESEVQFTGSRRVAHGQSEEIAKRQQTRTTLEERKNKVALQGLPQKEDLVENITGQGTT